MLKEALLKRKIRKAKGDFTTFVTSKDGRANVEAILKYAAKKANEEQRRIVQSAK